MTSDQYTRLLDAAGAAPHPVLPLPTLEQVTAILAQPDGQSRLADLFAARRETAFNMDHDPLHFGYEWDWYADARRLIKEYREVLILGGNDSGKSWFSAKWGVEQLEAHEEADFAFCHSTEDSSKNQQQQLVYKHLPPEWRTAKRNTWVDVAFKGKNGFTDNKFRVMNRRGFFFFYKQEPGVLTGYKLRGAACDELVTLPFLEELRARLLGRDGKLLLTFTPVDGYTATVADYLAGAEVIEWRPAKYLPGKNMPNMLGAPEGHMPYILRCRRSNAAVLCVFSEWSPFRKPEELERMIEAKSTSYIKQRLYGWPEKQAGVAIPKFNDIHIIRRHGPRVPGPVPPRPWLGAYPQLGKVGTNYCVADPGGSKNWFIKWYRVVPVGQDRTFKYCYREWPDLATHGEWALPGDKHDGIPGPAQRSEFGRGIIDYKRLILTLEGHTWDATAGRWDDSQAEVIAERYIDPRMGGTEVPTVEEGTSLIALMADAHHDASGKLVGPAMDWIPAPGGSGSIAHQQGIGLLNDWFDYDIDKAKAEGGVNVLNCPQFYVVEDCEQSVYAYRTYTGLDGEKGALKDVMDPDWYLRKADVTHIDAVQMKMRGGGSY